MRSYYSQKGFHEKTAAEKAYRKPYPVEHYAMFLKKEREY